MKQSVSSALAERIKERRNVTPTKVNVRYVKFTPEEMAIDAADVDASRGGPTFRGIKEWQRFLSFKRGYAKLDPKVRQAFPDNASVNAALRKVIELQEMKQSRGRKRKSA